MKKVDIVGCLLLFMGLTGNMASSYEKEQKADIETSYIAQSELFVMRSGEVSHDLRDAVSSSCAPDIRLTEKGYLDVANGVDQIQKSAPIDLVVASPVMRAQQSALIAADMLGLEKSMVVTDDRLREQYFGHFEGQKRAEFVAQFEHPEEQFVRGAADGESGEQVGVRVRSLLEEIATSPKYRGKNVLIITDAYPAAHIKKQFSENWEQLPGNGEWSRHTLTNHH